MKHNRKWFAFVATLVMVLALGACGKKPPPPPPAPPPPPPTPTASLSANPTTIQKGQPTTLTWSTENATDVTIDPIGKVDLSGSQQVTPQDSTNYRLVAKGPGGQQEATARVTVETPPPPPPPAPVQQEETLQQSFDRSVHDVFFDYDDFKIRPDAQQALQGDAAWLKAHPNAKVQIEGHCDERGSTEYNLTLGDNRARAVRDSLAQMGVNSSQLNVISFGKEKPFCTESNEQCWQQNRRGHFVLGAGSQ